MQPLAPATPLRRGVQHRLAALVMRIGGWRAEGQPPADLRCVLIAAPHTTNWDGFWLVVVGWWYGVPLSWLLKHTWFRWPLRTVLRALGAVPVDRRAPQGLVGQLVAAFGAADRLVLAIPPEGTRRKQKAWKSGFYHVARAAGVPICCGFLDYARRVGGFGPLVVPSGDLCADMDEIRAFYEHIPGKHPELFTPPRLEDEDAVERPGPT